MMKTIHRVEIIVFRNHQCQRGEDILIHYLRVVLIQDREIMKKKGTVLLNIIFLITTIKEKGEIRRKETLKYQKRFRSRKKCRIKKFKIGIFTKLIKNL
jgi:hypothetical protein